jgi:hypothetical protein
MECGLQFGKFKPGLATWHWGKCGVCYQEKEVTEPRDFGYLREGWKRK